MANIITILRIILTIPLFIYILYYKVDIFCFISFCLLGITDFLDGYVARKYNIVSDIGKILDGLADKFLMVLITISLLIKRIIPIWTLIIFIRDLISVIYALFYIKKKNIVIQSNIFGKIKTTFHIISISIVLLTSKWTYISSIFILLAICTFIPELIYIHKFIKNK